MNWLRSPIARRSISEIRRYQLHDSVRANSAGLNKIPTDRGFVSDNSGLGFLFRRLFAEATFKIDYYNSEGLPHLLSPLDPCSGACSSNLGILGLHKYLAYRHWFRKELAPVVMERLID